MFQKISPVFHKSEPSQSVRSPVCPGGSSLNRPKGLSGGWCSKRSLKGSYRSVSRKDTVCVWERIFASLSLDSLVLRYLKAQARIFLEWLVGHGWNGEATGGLRSSRKVQRYSG